MSNSNLIESKENNFDFSNLFIFEMSKNHAGSVDLGMKIIDEFGALAKEEEIRAAVKLQFRDLGSYIHPKYREGGDERMKRYFTSHISKEEFARIVNGIHNAGLYSMSTPFDETSVDTIDELGVQIIKVASSSVRDWPLLERISKSNKPVVISTGGLSLTEIDEVVDFLQSRNVHFALLHCVGMYPTPKEYAELNRIKRFIERYEGVTIGFSTHEDPKDLDQIKMALALGAKCFEKHVIVLDEKIESDESYKKVLRYTATPDQTRLWIRAFKEAKVLLGTDSKDSYDPTDKELESLSSMKRGVYAARDIEAGSNLTSQDVFFAIPLQRGQLEVGDWKDGIIAGSAIKKEDPVIG